MKKETKVKKALNIESQFEKLVALGKKKGHLTYEEINDFLPEDVISPEQIEKVFAILEKENVEIVDSEEELKPANKEDAEEGKQMFDTDRRIVAEPSDAAEPVADRHATAAGRACEGHEERGAARQEGLLCDEEGAGI